jgi:DNA-directed RNA polymerase subunit RPC12/RpoP
MPSSSDLANVTCPYCGNKWETHQKVPALSCTKCRKSFPNPFSPKPGKIVKCPTCKHEWCTISKEELVRCPQCFKKILLQEKKSVQTVNPGTGIKVRCVHCGHTWFYTGHKKIGEIDECPTCRKNTRIINADPDLVPSNKPRIFSSMMRIGDLHLRYTEPEIQALFNKYNLSHEQITETAIKLFILWIEMVENQNFSRDELESLKKVLKESELDGLIPVIDKRLYVIEKTQKNKLVFGFGSRNK